MTGKRLAIEADCEGKKYYEKELPSLPTGRIFRNMSTGIGKNVSRVSEAAIKLGKIEGQVLHFTMGSSIAFASLTEQNLESALESASDTH